MLKIYKYKITPNDKIELPIPSGAKILTVQAQFENPVLWALVNPDSPVEQRFFRLVGTGFDIREDASRLNYINTFQIYGGDLVFHLFEITPEN